MNPEINHDNLASVFHKHNAVWEELRQVDRELFMPGDGSNYRTFHDVKLQDEFLSSANFESCKFINCIFENTQFQDCFFYSCEFTDCEFRNCELSNVKFVEVLFENCFFNGGFFHQGDCSDVHFDKVAFADFRDMIEVRFGGCSYANLQFVRCRLSYLTFENQTVPENRQIIFLWCEVVHCFFYWLKLDEVCFDECTLGLSVFVNCEVGDNTIMPSNETSTEDYNSVDLQTVLKSSIPSEILKKQFGIFNSEFKPYIMDMVRKVELHTVFISYSFHDKEFAHRLDNALRSRGVVTFLWEKDAPAGQRLKKIMSHNVQKFDKLLFIASEHSLKSDACHYELSNGREIQDKNWSLVLFPVHIDNFLFTVRQEDIPKIKRAEVWNNIEELREIHSMDFSLFSSKTYDQSGFDQQVEKLVRGLRKKKDVALD